MASATRKARQIINAKNLDNAEKRAALNALIDETEAYFDRKIETRGRGLIGFLINAGAAANKRKAATEREWQRQRKGLRREKKETIQQLREMLRELPRTLISAKVRSKRRDALPELQSHRTS